MKTTNATTQAALSKIAAHGKTLGEPKGPYGVGYKLALREAYALIRDGKGDRINDLVSRIENSTYIDLPTRMEGAMWGYLKALSLWSEAAKEAKAAA